MNARINANLTEAELETKLMEEVDSLDRRFLNSPMTQEEYDSKIAKLYQVYQEVIDRAANRPSKSYL